MCGVAGIWNPAAMASGESLSLRLSKMSQRIAHRGPDDDGIYTDTYVGLAHRRLSVIDLHGGHQPMMSSDEQLVVSYNGEIFNFVELRETLVEKGWAFRTESDTEVLLAAYHHYGEQFLSLLNGQFALALWDKRQKKLLLARDHAGIHPLFFTRQGGEVLFASEIKSLMPAMHHSLQPDYSALDHIFTFWSPLPPATGFQGVEQLMPGECLVLSESAERRFVFFEWSYPPSGQERRDSPEQLAAELREILEDSVRIRLRADVPVGCYLSGGLDSSATTALVASMGKKPTTFSLNFSDPSVDEREWQESLYQHLGVEHRSITVGETEIANGLPRAIWHAERPILRSAPVPMMHLSSLVRDSGFKVVLTGEGADEVLSGYDIFKESKVRHFWARQAGSQWRWALLRRLYPWMDLGSLNYLKRFFGQDLERLNDSVFSHLPRWKNTAQSKQFYSDAMRSKVSGSAMDAVERWMPQQADQWAPLHQGQFLESRLLMDGYLLSSQGDRMLMANGIEGRFPFLDPRLIQFANSIAPSRKLPGLNEKALLKMAVKDLLPKGILNRPKQPYRAPDGTSLASASFMESVLSKRSIERGGYFDAKKVEMLWRKAQAGRLHAMRDQMALVGIVSTQIWHEQFIEGKTDFINVAA